ncbi:Serine/threonine protein kinase [Giardia duodenalis]|uniref:Serine/threonine protein kinase n=1 Tax=Giardia intestinalis TaxID=5741 RepID=V6TTK0_GIAIN|nr:Serine/threonine protein kinase [Giardia intestinalis]
MSVPSTATPNIPTFGLDELRECVGKTLRKDGSGTIYSLKGFPELIVKEVWLSKQPKKLREITKFELEAMTQFFHPGVLKYHQVIEDGDFFYVVMDRYDRDLQHFIADHKSVKKHIPRELMLSIMRQLADALAYLHEPTKMDSCGNSLPAIVHRDLKPANVLMSRDGERVVIADFGLCKDAQHDGNTLAGSPPYMAPETLLSNKTSCASDIWALGVIIYELATLKRPNFLEGKKPTRVFVGGWRPNLSAIEDEFIRSILKKIFVLDPTKRLTANELAEQFNAFNATIKDLKLQVRTLEITLNNANNKIQSLEKELNAKSLEIDSLKNIIALLNEDPKKQDMQVSATAQSSKSEPVILGTTASQSPSGCHIDFSWTPLMHAALIGDIETAKQHLSDKDKKNSDGETALIIAARAGHANIVELLDPTDKIGVTALMRAANRGDIEMVKLLVPLQKRKKTIKDIYISGLPIHKGTALMIAASCGHTELVRLLVEHEVGMRDSYGYTALMMAVRNSRTGCVKLLLEKEGGMQNSKGWTALIMAAEKGHPECVELLVKHEGSIQDNHGSTALMKAAENGYTNCVQLLVEKENRMKKKTGETALMVAAESNSPECIRLLLDKEACMQDENGWTALMRATRLNNLECAKLLTDKERNIKTTHKWSRFPSGRTALDIAKRMDHHKLVSFLTK